MKSILKGEGIWTHWQTHPEISSHSVSILQEQEPIKASNDSQARGAEEYQDPNVTHIF